MTTTIEAEQPSNPSKDKGLNAKFDRALKKIAKEPKLKPLKLKRKPGRPKAGRAVFTQQHIDALPEYGSISAVSRALVVKHTTLQQWCVHGNNPLGFVNQGGHKIFRKDVLVAWLKATRRFGTGAAVKKANAAERAAELLKLASIERESGKAGCIGRAEQLEAEALTLES